MAPTIQVSPGHLHDWYGSLDIRLMQKLLALMATQSVAEKRHLEQMLDSLVEGRRLGRDDGWMA